MFIYTIRNVIPAAQGRAEINVAGEEVCDTTLMHVTQEK
jgi:hypothetical protein